MKTKKIQTPNRLKLLIEAKNKNLIDGKSFNKLSNKHLYPKRKTTLKKKVWSKLGKDKWFRAETNGDFGKSMSVELRKFHDNTFQIDRYKFKSGKIVDDDWKRFKTKKGALAYAKKLMKQ